MLSIKPYLPVSIHQSEIPLSFDQTAPELAQPEHRPVFETRVECFRGPEQTILETSSRASPAVNNRSTDPSDIGTFGRTHLLREAVVQQQIAHKNLPRPLFPDFLGAGCFRHLAGLRCLWTVVEQDATPARGIRDTGLFDGATFFAFAGVWSRSSNSNLTRLEHPSGFRIFGVGAKPAQDSRGAATPLTPLPSKSSSVRGAVSEYQT